MAFNINAQVILSGPKNIKAVTKRIKSELAGVTVPVNLKIDKNISKNLGAFNKGVKDLTSNLNILSGAATKTDSSIRKLSTGLQTLNRTNTKMVTANKEVAAAVGRTGKAFEEAGSELQSFGKDAALAIRRFTAFTVATSVVFGFVRAIGKATGAAIDYEREVVKLVQVTGASAQKIGQFKKTIDELSVSLGIDANELASLGRVFAQTGQSIDQVRSSLRSVARSSLAPSFGEMKSTAEGLIAAMAQFNIQANKSESVLGALNAVSKRFAVEAEDLISVIRRAGGVFSTAAGQMKDPQEALNELIGIFTAVRSTTRESADTIATGLRTIFTRIQRGRTIEFLKQFNIELLDAKGNFVGLFPAFQKLSAGLKTLVQSGDAVKLSAVTEELGGIRQVGKLIPAIVGFNKALAATKVAAKGASEGLGKDVRLALQPLGKQFEQVAARFNTLIRTISESKTFQNLAKVALSTANAFLSVAEALTPLIPLITTLATIKISRGLFEFGQGFVGGLRKGGGSKGAGGAIGSVITGGDKVDKGGAAKRSTSAGEKAVAQALRNNIAAVRQSTTATSNLQSAMTQSSLKLSASVTSLIASNTNLISAIGNLTLAIGRSGGGLGGTRPGFRPRKFARGGVVRGPSHAQGGVLAELEGGERVLPRGYQFGPLRGTGGVGRLSLRERLLLGRGAAGGRTQVRRIARLRDDAEFSGLTERGSGAIGIAQGELATKGRAGKGATAQRREVLRKLQAGARDGADTYGGAFLSSKAPPPRELIGRLDDGAILAALSKNPLWRLIGGKNKKGTFNVGARRGQAAGLSSLRNKIFEAAKQKSDFSFVAGVLTKQFGQQIEGSILEGVELAVTKGGGQLAKAVGSKPTVKGGSRDMARVLRSANIDNVIGNLFEAIITTAGVPYDLKDSDAANAAFDFPRGLKGKSKAFGRPELANAPTDAKTRFTPDNIGTFVSKVKSFEAQKLEELLFSAFSGRAGANLLGTLSTKGAASEIRGLRSLRAENLLKRRQRLQQGSIALEGIDDLPDIFSPRPLRRAAGGPIFSPRGTDTVPAMLTPGEYVINRSSAQAIGYGKLDNLNRLAKGGKVRYYNAGSPGGVSSGRRAVGSSGRGASETVDTFTDSVANSIIAVTGLTAAVSGLSFNSMEELIASAGSLALAFAQLQFFLGADTFRNLAGIAGRGGVLSGVLGKLPGAGAFGAAKSAFGQTPFGPPSFQAVKSKGFLGITQTVSKPLTGLAKGLTKTKAGLNAFRLAIGGFTGLFKGLPGLITSLLIAPITNFAVDKFLGGKIEEIAGVRGRKGVSAGAVGVASTVGGAVKGAATGAAIGSIVLGPGFGTALGAVLGGVIQGVAEGAEAQRQQELFNAFSRLKDSSAALSETFDKIEKSGGALNDAQQRRAERELRSTNIERREVIELLSKTAKRDIADVAAVNRANSPQNISGRFALPGARRTDELSEAQLQAVRPNKGIFSFDRGTGTSLKMLDSLNKFFEENEQLIERQKKATSLNIESLFKSIDSAALSRTISGIGELDQGPDRILRGTGRFRGQAAGTRVGRRGKAVVGDRGDLLSSKTSRSFNDIRNNLNQLADANDKGARSLRTVLDDQFFLEFTEQFRKQADNLRKAGDPAASRLRALNEGFKRLQGPLSEISRVGNLDDLLNNLQKQLLKMKDTTRDEALEIIRLVRGVQGLTTERFKELDVLKQLALLQKQATRSLSNFSERLNDFRETTSNASTDFSIFIDNLQSDMAGILGDRMGRKNVSGRFTGSDLQFSQLEAGGGRANVLRNLSAIQQGLPGIISQTVKELRAEGGDQSQGLVQGRVRENLINTFGNNIPELVLDQIAAGIGNALNRQGKVIANAVDGLAKALDEDIKSIVDLSPILKEANDAIKNAYGQQLATLAGFSKALQGQTRVADQNIQRTIAIRQRGEALTDRLSGLGGGRGAPTRAEARRRRNQQIGGILGFGGAAGLPSLTRGPGAGIGAVGRDLLSRRAGLLRQRRGIDERRRFSVTAADRAQSEVMLERNTSALSRTNRALFLLANDTTELSSIMTQLEDAVSRQTQAESGIRTFAELTEAIASGKIGPEEIKNRFAVPISAFNKLEKAVLRGDPNVAAGMTFRELLALQKSLEGGDPVLGAALRDLADDAAVAVPGGRGVRDPQAILRQVFEQITGGLGATTVRSLRAQGRGPLADMAQRNLDIQQRAIAEREARGQGAGALLGQQRNLVTALNLADQMTASQVMRSASEKFSAAVNDFAVALRILNAQGVAQVEPGEVVNRAMRNNPPLPRDVQPGQLIDQVFRRLGGELNDIFRLVPENFFRSKGGPVKKMRGGGPVRGPAHAQGGVLTELEGGEYVIPKKAMQGGDAVTARNESIRKRNQEINKLREKRGMKPFKIGASGRFMRDKTGRLAYGGWRAAGAADDVERQKPVPRRVIEPGSRPVEMAPLGGTRPAGSGLSDLVGPVSTGGGTAYSSKYGGLRRRPIFSQGRRSGYSRINMGPNPGAVGARRRSSSKPWTWEQAGAGVTGASIRRGRRGRRHVASLRRIVQTEGQPSSRFGLGASVDLGPLLSGGGGFGPSLKGIMALRELRQIADASRPPRTSLTAWRRHVAALRRKAIKGDPVARKKLGEIEKRARSRRKRGVIYRANGGGVPDPERVRKPTDYFENWLRRGHYRSMSPKGMAVGEAPRTEEQRKARRDQYLFLNPLAKETPFDFLLPQNTSSPSRAALIVKGGFSDNPDAMGDAMKREQSEGGLMLFGMPSLADQMGGLEQGQRWSGSGHRGAWRGKKPYHGMGRRPIIRDGVQFHAGGGLIHQIPEIGGRGAPRTANETNIPILKKRIEDLKLLISTEKFFGTDLIGSHLKGPGLQSQQSGITAKGRRKALLTGPDLETDFMRRMAEEERAQERKRRIEKLIEDNERLLRRSDDVLGRPYPPPLPRSFQGTHKRRGGPVSYLQVGGVAGTIQKDAAVAKRAREDIARRKQFTRFLGPRAKPLSAQKTAALKSLGWNENPLLLSTGNFRSFIPGQSVAAGLPIWQEWSNYLSPRERLKDIAAARKFLESDIRTERKAGLSPRQQKSLSAANRARQEKEAKEDEKFDREFDKKGGYLGGGLFPLGSTDFDTPAERSEAINKARKSMEAKLYTKRWESIREQYEQYVASGTVTPSITQQFNILAQRYQSYQGRVPASNEAGADLNESLAYFEGLQLRRGGLPRWRTTPQQQSRMAQKGQVPYLAGGGSIFKAKGTDTVPAMLTPGEFVVRRDAVNAVGLPTLRSINSMGGGGQSLSRGGTVYAQNGGLMGDPNPAPRPWEWEQGWGGSSSWAQDESDRGNPFPQMDEWEAWQQGGPAPGRQRVIPPPPAGGFGGRQMQQMPKRGIRNLPPINLKQIQRMIQQLKQLRGEPSHLFNKGGVVYAKNGGWISSFLDSPVGKFMAAMGGKDINPSPAGLGGVDKIINKSLDAHFNVPPQPYDPAPVGRPDPHALSATATTRREFEQRKNLRQQYLFQNPGAKTTPYDSPAPPAVPPAPPVPRKLDAFDYHKTRVKGTGRHNAPVKGKTSYEKDGITYEQLLGKLEQGGSIAGPYAADFFKEKRRREFEKTRPSGSNLSMGRDPAKGRRAYEKEMLGPYTPDTLTPPTPPGRTWRPTFPGPTPRSLWKGPMFLEEAVDPAVPGRIQPGSLPRIPLRAAANRDPITGHYPVDPTKQPTVPPKFSPSGLRPPEMKLPSDPSTVSVPPPMQRWDFAAQMDRVTPATPAESDTILNVPFPEGATPARRDLLKQLDRKQPIPRGGVDRRKIVRSRRRHTPQEPVGAGEMVAGSSGMVGEGLDIRRPGPLQLDAAALAFVKEQKRRTALINKLGPDGLRWLQSRIPLTTVNAAPEGTSPALWKAMGERSKRISSWDILTDERFENLYVQALEYTQGKDAKRKAVGYGLGRNFADRQKNATPEERKEFERIQIDRVKHEKAFVFLSNALGRYTLEAGLYKFGVDDPWERISGWLRKWGNGDLEQAIINRRIAQDKTDDDKFLGKAVGPKRQEGKVDPLFAGYKVDKDSGRIRIKDRSARGRRKFGSTGTLRGAGTVIRNPAQRRLSKEELARGKVPGGLTTQRFDIIGSQRAAKARVEEEKAKARTGKLRKSQRKMSAKEQLEQRRIDAGLPPGATKDDIISAEASTEFLKKVKSGDPEQMRKAGLGQLDEKTGKFDYALIRISASMKAEAESALYPAFVPKLNKKSSGMTDPGPGPQGKAASGGPFIDYMKLPGPGEVTQEMWDAMVGVKRADTAMQEQLDATLEDIEPGKVSSGQANDILGELHSEETSRRDARYIDAFGNPGGPGYYVEKAAWMTAYAISDLKRQKRDRFRIQKGTGKRIKIGGKQDPSSKGVQRLRAPRSLKPGTPAHTRAMDRRNKGMARAQARNSKRLAGINKIRVKNGLQALGSDDVNEFGVPLVGWKEASTAETQPFGLPGGMLPQFRPEGMQAGGVVYAQGGGLFRQIPEISGGFVRGAKTTAGERQKRLNYPFEGKSYNPGQKRQKRGAMRMWKTMQARRERSIDDARDSYHFGPISFTRTSRVMDWMSDMGDSAKSYFSGETPAQKTERLGLGHSTGYGGMKDPRLGMGGADYMHMQERRPLDLHGYQQGGSVIQRGRQWDSTRSLRNPPTMRGRQRGKGGPFLPSPTGIFSAMGDIMRRKWGMESPAEKTERLGFGHTTGYGGMKDPRFGMGGADYMRTKERGKGFHGYNRGGNVDSVLGALTPGEFVMRREAVDKYGKKFMNDINLQKLNNGGGVGAGAPVGGGGKGGVSQSKDLERGAALAGESILNAFTQGSQMVGEAIRQALSPENLAAQIGDVVGQKMQESLAATSIDLKGNMGVDVRLSGNGAAGDMTAKVQDSIKNAIAGVLNNVTNVDGSSKDPSLHQPKV